ncbi:hypothetical protein VZC37_20695 [Gordonia sp. LSe1-13]|uniref:Uncharacterized protein n=1 Tax=Gordonia sesuvii TaxID=3116777 RepID=A0ABU7MIA2_9ACTN|nr:hypothetical protein [Gordonia sp. LSe1-13]
MSDFPYKFQDKPPWMSRKAWHYLRKHKPDELIKKIEQYRDDSRPLGLR